MMVLAAEDNCVFSLFYQVLARKNGLCNSLRICNGYVRVQSPLNWHFLLSSMCVMENGKTLKHLSQDTALGCFVF